MSGHSKWSKVKHQKATTDVVKSAAFTKATHAIMIAAREGCGARLRLAVERARAVNMPKENIERAIAKVAGEGTVGIEQMTYEGYGPGSVALLIHAATDNRQRTVSQIKNVLERAGGTLVSPGALNYVFERRGTSIEPKQEMSITLNDEQKRRIDALIEELEELDDVQTVFTNLAQEGI
jgi:YebC/PmpR family DNA-binding regulatory protein